MGKNDFLTPKAIANRIKSKGLQKLRWYCQMCQKQCRDENGFKCHLTSDSHKRQMEVFGQAPDRVIEGYSEEFERMFMDHLRQAHPFSRVSAKVVYNEFIADRHHIHMNSTKWYTLTDFVKYLGRSGQCKVDETPKGWFMSVIQRDHAAELGSAARAKRERAEKEEEERHQEALAAQIERAQKAARTDDGPVATALERDAAGAPVRLALEPLGPRMHAAHRAPPDVSGRANDVFSTNGREGNDTGARPPTAPPPRPKSKLEVLMERDKAAKRAQEARAAQAASAADAQGRGTSTSGRQDQPWLHEGIVVKVMSKQLQEQGYYKKKGLVEKLASPYVGRISMLDSGDILQVDQAQLETVLPSPGGMVLVLKGPQRGEQASMLGVDVNKFQAEVQLTRTKGKLWLDYEDICKYSR